jgi:hypothetical protein
VLSLLYLPFANSNLVLKLSAGITDIDSAADYELLKKENDY